MLQLFPEKERLGRTLLPYGLAALATGLLLSKASTGEVYTVEVTKYIKQVEVKEVVKYVESNKTDTRRTEITRPDGTRIVSIHDSQVGRTESTVENSRKETEHKEERKEERKIARAQYNLGLFIDTNTNIGVSLGARLGELPITVQLYTVPTNMYGAVGLQLEL